MVWLRGYFVTHPAGTFICIYSSWLTCHSPSSNVSIQGTIIYRIIDSQAPQGLPCQVTSQPLLVFSRGRSVLPTRLSIPSDAASSTSLFPGVPVPSAPWVHPERAWPTCCGMAFQMCADREETLPIAANKRHAAASPSPALLSDSLRRLSVSVTCL